MFALIDCNNFYASCERVFNPNLRDKPIVVLSNNDGCVIARSNEAKEFGVPMGAPAFEYKKLFKEQNINVFSSNYPLYGDMSSRVMDLLREYTPEVEVYSIDEAFLKFEGFEYYNLNTIGLEMQQRVTKGTGVPISVGFAPTKALSKVANRVAKKYPNKTNSVYVIDDDNKRIKALKWLKIEDVWGIGRKHTKRLNDIGVFNAYQFTLLSDSWVRKHMSVVGLRLKHDLQGKPTLDLDTPANKKIIATTRSFQGMLTDFKDVRERVGTFAISCAEKLRRQQSHCNAIMVFLHTNGHRKDLKQYGRNIVIKTDYPTNSSIDLNRYVQIGLKAIFKDGYHYKKAGVIVMSLTPENQNQLTLYKKPNPKHEPIMQIVDRMNIAYGNNKIKFGSQSLGRQWKMRQEKLSPRYSTNINEIITIKV